jgi:DNA-binding IclR family transcriptional regulator
METVLRILATRTGRGPRTPIELRDLLAAEALRGWSEEDGEVTVGFASVAACVRDFAGRPSAAIGCTFTSASILAGSDRAVLARTVRTVADRLSRRMAGRR